MPRITLSRVLGLVPLAWVCLVATWFFLPSPVVLADSRLEHIRQRLLHRYEVTTVVELGDTFKNDRNWLNRCSDCRGLIFDWQLESNYATDSLILHIGNGRINMTEAALRGPKAESTAVEPQIPYLSAPIKAQVHGGGTDHETAMPWFTWTDKILIDWTMHSGEVDLSFRSFSPEAGVVEIWKDISMWATYEPGTPVRETEREVGLIARFTNVPTQAFTGASGLRANTANLGVTALQGQLPSKTWPIRSIIAGPLYVPTFMLSVIVWSFTFNVVPLSVVLAFQMLCVLLIFARFERFNISPSRWCCKDRSKRPKERVWGSAGPINDEESGLLAIRPQKLTTTFPTISKPSRSRAPVFDKY